MIRGTKTGVDITVRVIPRARKSEIAGTRGDALLVRLAAPPLDGAANAALIELLATRLGVSGRSISIVSGERSRDKRVAVAGVSPAEALRALSPGC